MSRAALVSTFRKAEAAYLVTTGKTGDDARDASIHAWRVRNAALAELRAFDLNSGT